jgi:hypothetical protein
MSVRQASAVAPRIPDTQGIFCLTAWPDTSPGGRLSGAALSLPQTNPNGAGVLNVPGTYECEVLCDGWNVLEAAVRVSAVTGNVIPYLRTRWADKTTRLESAGVNLVASTPQTLSLTNLRGQRKAYLVFTLAPGDSVTFDRAEFNGL